MAEPADCYKIDSGWRIKYWKETNPLDDDALRAQERQGGDGRRRPGDARAGGPEGLGPQAAAGCTTTRSWPASPARPPTRSPCSRASKRSWSSTTATCRAAWWNWPRTGARTRCCATWRRCCWWPTPTNTYILSGNGRRDRARRGRGGHRLGRPVRQGRRHRADAKTRELSAREIAEKAMEIAGKICIYTNENIIYRGAGLTWSSIFPARPTMTRRCSTN